MSSRFFKLVIAVFVLAALPLGAQVQSQQKIKVLIDMATCGENETRTVGPGTSFEELNIWNRLPKSRYEVAVIQSEIEEEPFSTAHFAFGGQQIGGSPRELANDEKQNACTRVISKLENASDERAVAAIGAENEAADCFISATRTSEVLSYKLDRGQQLEISVVRDGKTCSTVWTTGLPGKWFTTYGFTFLPNRDRNYFAKQTTIPAVPATSTSPAKPESTVFKITEEEDREDLDFVPSILFHYKRPKTNWTWVAGLGYDLENIAAFFGRGYIIHQNVLVTAGLAIHEQGDLAGRYNVGDDLKEAIDSAQLSSKSYGANLYVGVSFRFGSNIFSERDTAAKKVADERAKKAETAQKAAEAKLLASQKLDACNKRVEETLLTERQSCENSTSTGSEGCAELEGDEEKSCLEKLAAAEKNCLERAEAKAKTGKAECVVNPDKPAAATEEEEEETPKAPSEGNVASGGAEAPAKPARPTPSQVACIKGAALDRAKKEEQCMKDNRDYFLTKACLNTAQKEEAAAKAKCFLPK